MITPSSSSRLYPSFGSASNSSSVQIFCFALSADTGMGSRLSDFGAGSTSPQHELPVHPENLAQRERRVVLKRLQFAVHFDAGFVRTRRLGLVQLHERVRNVADVHLLALLPAPAPERLQCRTICRALADLKRHDLGIEHVGHDLPPKPGPGAAAGRAN